MYHNLSQNFNPIGSTFLENIQIEITKLASCKNEKKKSLVEITEHQNRKRNADLQIRAIKFSQNKHLV